MSDNADLIKELRLTHEELERQGFEHSADAVDRAIAALSQQAEPVAWRRWNERLKDYTYGDFPEFGNADLYEPLYASPQPAPVEPDGYVLVPREPTRDMCEAAFYSTCGNIGATAAEQVYKTMIETTPKEPK